MRFLAIDLEACNTYVHGSVFSIGVVEADENFNVTHKEDIIINPNCKFCTRFRKPITFAVSQEDVKNAPPLSEIYPRLKEMLKGDVIVMAHSANNDMYMLNEACKRAKLPPLKFKYICTQMIYSAVYDVMTGIGLDKAAEDLHLTFFHHKADDDAEMAMELLKSCCEKMQCTYFELEKTLGIKRGVNKNYTFEPMRCDKLDKLRNKHKEENKKHLQVLKKELKNSNEISIIAESRSFDLTKQGVHDVIYTSLDAKSEKLKVGDTVYVVRQTAHKDVFKAKINEIRHFNSLLTFYNSIDRNLVGAKNESELEFLSRVYKTFDETKSTYKGICMLRVAIEE